MQIKKFYAPSLPAAMRDIRKALGPDAVIMSTRYLSTDDVAILQQNTNARVEVTAARETPESTMPVYTGFDRELSPTARVLQPHREQAPLPPANPAAEPKTARQTPLLARYTEIASTPLGGSFATPAPTLKAHSVPQPPQPIETPRVAAAPSPEKTIAAPSAAPTTAPRKALHHPDLRTMIRLRNAGKPLQTPTPVKQLAPEEAVRARPFTPPQHPAKTAPSQLEEEVAQHPQHPSALKPLLKELRALNDALGESKKAAFEEASLPAFTRKATFPLAAQLRHEGASLLASDAVQKCFEKQGVDDVLTHRILSRLYHAQTRRDAGPYKPGTALHHDPNVKGTFERLVKTIQAFTPSSRVAAPRRRIALVGPTGVGKTTSIAKIAATFSLRAGKSVALISLDTYRIAASEQIKTYAKLLSVPIEIAANGEEFIAALDRFANMDVVLIDTPGYSPKDQTAIRGLGSMLRKCPELEVHLVVPAGLRPEETRLVQDGFDPTRYDHLIFSKLDESVTWGTLLNTWIFTGHAVSYFTTGQRVPEDLETASMEYLCDTLLSAQLPSHRKVD
ncbi:TPA: hypothetical protein DDW35_06375 [Candidatus Sumerlaeota bacterium]|jgi:flagellar biosynthesis GTPase FlhF|nr:hypothetical protein [Candidatus Sumerlaeota bacterium]